MVEKSKICTRCIMDASVPTIRFNANGVCNYCTLHDRMDKSQGHLQGTIYKLCERIRESGRRLDYDCVVGLSGGTDSTYCLYVIKQMGLRPLAVHFDNGWVSDAAKANISAAEDSLQVEVRRVTADWEDLKAGYNACLAASTPEVCMPCEVGGYSTLYSIASEVGVKYIILGLSYKTEGINPLAWHYVDGMYLSDVLKRHAPVGRQACLYNRLSIPSFARFALWHKIRAIQLPLYMHEYRDKDIREILKKEMGWVYGGHHHFDCAYKPFVSYIHNRKFNADLRRVSLSAQIRTGEISRKEGLAALEEPIGATESQLEYCLGRLGLSMENFERILKAPTMSFRDYQTYYSIISRMKLPLRVMSRLGMFPETTYEKMFES
jgi:hypothetical protein